MPVHHIGHRIHVLESVDSSNNYAMGLARNQEAMHGEVFFALEQTAGKGQKGRQWTTQKGQNIMLSIVLETTPLQSQSLFHLSMAMALGCFDFLKNQAGDECSIKWPNDLYWRDRKAGGILIENSWKGQSWQFAIVGIGININQVDFPEGIRKPVSLKQITGKSVDLMDSVRHLCNCLEIRWQQLLDGNKAQISADYNQALFALGQSVKLRSGTTEFSAKILGVSSDGELLTDHALKKNFQVGEVEWVWT